MQSAEDWSAKNTPALFTVRDSGASLSKAKCVRISKLIDDGVTAEEYAKSQRALAKSIAER